MGVPGVANVRSGASGSGSCRCRSIPSGCETRGVTLDQVIETAGNALWVSPLTFLEASTPGTGGLHRHAQPAARRPAHLADHDARPTWPRCTVEEHERPAAAARRRGHGRSRTTSRSSATPSSTRRPGLLLVVEKFPEANTLEVTRGVEDALDALRPGWPASRSTPTFYRPARYIETRDRQPRARRCSSALVAVVLLLGAFFFDWRTALISVVAIPLSLVGRRARALRSRGDDQRDRPGRARGRARRSSSTTRSSTSTTSSGACASTDGEAATSRPRRSSSRPRSRCAARSSTRR